MSYSIKSIFLQFVVLLTCSSALAANNTFNLDVQQWNAPRQDSSIIHIAPLRDAVQLYQSTPDAQLIIKYPGGDVGTLWAHELQSWLVSLGISSTHIELVPGSSDPSMLQISVTPSH